MGCWALATEAYASALVLLALLVAGICLFRVGLQAVVRKGLSQSREGSVKPTEPRDPRAGGVMGWRSSRKPASHWSKRSPFARPPLETEAVDDLLGNPFAFWPKRLGGVIGPALLVPAGLRLIFTQHARMHRPHSVSAGLDSLFFGEPVIAGAFILSAAGFLHCRYFWRNVDRLAPYSALGQIASLIVFIGILLYLTVRMLLFA